MKKTAPVLLGVAIGMFAFAEFYIPDWQVGWLRDELLDWGEILSAFAFVLGAVNLVQVNYPKIRRRERDWQYKVVMVAAGVGMLVCGLKWHVFWAHDAAPPSIVHGTGATAHVEVDAPDDAMIQIGGAPAVIGGRAYAVDVPPGKTSIRVFRRVAGYRDYAAELDLAAGDTARVAADPPLVWGPQGRVYVWLYDHVFAPCNSTMFALLAFFVVSAAFRAFRMRNVEATLLLGSAIIVMLAAAPMGAYLSDDLVAVKQWILDIPNNGGRRAIMMGAAIGAIATSLRIILGLERSHLGAD